MTETNHQTSPPLLRLAGLKTSQLPPVPSSPTPGGDNDNDDGQQQQLRAFIATLLQEAVPFIDTAAPRAADFSDPADPAPPASNTLWRSKGVKSQSGSDAKVELSERVVVRTVGPVPPRDAGSGKAAAGNGGDDGGGGGGKGGEKRKSSSIGMGVGKTMTMKREKTTTDKKEGKEGKTKRRESETWVCRRSVHADTPTKGSASWAEFVECLRDRHAETEDAFTPGVLGHRTAVAWCRDGADAPRAPGLSPVVVEAGGIAWGRFGLSLVEMKHKVPPPLKPRVFPVLQLVASAVPRGGEDGGGGAGAGASAGAGAGERRATGSAASPGTRRLGRVRDEFIVVSVTVEDFAEGAMKDTAGLSSADKKKGGGGGLVIGAYAAVERVRRLPGGEVEWLMATASDAKGVLPMWVQTKAVPGQIAKDVGLFLGWIAREREKGKRTSRGDFGGGDGGDALPSTTPALDVED